MKPSDIYILAVVCGVCALGWAAPAPAPAPQPDPVTAFGGQTKKEVIAPAQPEQPSDNASAKGGLTPVVIPEHVHMVDKRSPTKKFGYGGGGYGYGYPSGGGYGGGCNVCSGGGGGYPVGGGYGGGSYSQSSSSSQSSAGSWGRK